ncbi:MAG: tRNA (adenosine(37)-N6)-threonylcarbamoyltransferase complex transferase subunit TsaD [Sulfurospirillum sp.]|nr:tRNA (adenosine(37)-N6)-threonylcarbamoyltransferase complex transferase subunit TsaD [Sulfurospirillum sp.]
MILSIESSCDDSSIAITRTSDAKLLYHKKISQELEHSIYGGVVPELAARLHAKALPDILEETKDFFSELKAIAVTHEPGLSVSLVEGVSMAKALVVALNIPLIAINHLKGHIYSLFIDKPKSVFPLGVLLVSGGHTQVLHVRDFGNIQVLASTLDDSFGESFDKVAKMLGLAYPGGPIVEQYAKSGDERAFAFTIPMQGPRLDFSYSGLKNQVRLATSQAGVLDDKTKSDICASFQRVACEHLLQKLDKIFKLHQLSDFAIVGGASANAYLRAKVQTLTSKHNICLHVSQLEYCSDNAAMIGRCAIEAYKLGDFVSIDDIRVNPKMHF